MPECQVCGQVGGFHEPWCMKASVNQLTNMKLKHAMFYCKACQGEPGPHASWCPECAELDEAKIPAAGESPDSSAAKLIGEMIKPFEPVEMKYVKGKDGSLMPVPAVWEPEPVQVVQSHWESVEDIPDVIGMHQDEIHDGAVEVKAEDGASVLMYFHDDGKLHSSPQQDFKKPLLPATKPPFAPQMDTLPEGWVKAEGQQMQIKGIAGEWADMGWVDEPANFNFEYHYADDPQMYYGPSVPACDCGPVPPGASHYPSCPYAAGLTCACGSGPYYSPQGLKLHKAVHAPHTVGKPSQPPQPQVQLSDETHAKLFGGKKPEPTDFEPNDDGAAAYKQALEEYLAKKEIAFAQMYGAGPAKVQQIQQQASMKFKCFKCGKFSFDANTMTEHMKLEHKIALAKLVTSAAELCKWCDYDAWGVDSAIDHALQSHPKHVDEVVGSMCPVDYAQGGFVGSPLDVQEGLTKVKCKWCPAKFANVADMESHVKQQHFGKMATGMPHHCPVCGHAAATVSGQAAHAVATHMENVKLVATKHAPIDGEDTDAVCKWCGNHYVSLSSVAHHAASAHPKELMVAVKADHDSQWVGKFAPAKCWHEQWQLFVCPACQYKLGDFGQMADHAKVYHLLDVPLAGCDACGMEGEHAPWCSSGEGPKHEGGVDDSQDDPDSVHVYAGPNPQSSHLHINLPAEAIYTSSINVTTTASEGGMVTLSSKGLELSGKAGSFQIPAKPVEPDPFIKWGELDVVDHQWDDDDGMVIIENVEFPYFAEVEIDKDLEHPAVVSVRLKSPLPIMLAASEYARLMQVLGMPDEVTDMGVDKEGPMF